jgi:hypothetical protein
MQAGKQLLLMESDMQRRAAGGERGGGKLQVDVRETWVLYCVDGN